MTPARLFPTALDDFVILNKFWILLRTSRLERGRDRVFDPMEHP